LHLPCRPAALLHEDTMTHGTVYLVDDNDAFRDSTRWLLEGEGFAVDVFPSAAAFLARYRPGSADTGPQLLVLDVRMPEMSGVQLQDELIKRGASLPIVFITAHGDVPLAVQAMRKGALNFIEKPFADEVLIDAVRNGLQRAAQDQKRDAAGAEAQARVNSLTPRERQVLDLVIEGRLNKTIADTLGISIKTVELHRAHMMEKMGAQSLAHLVQIAVAARG
jgi:FixJ family two-component response regulator